MIAKKFLNELRMNRIRVRFILWASALLAGLLVATFAVMADYALKGFLILVSYSLYASIFLTPFIGMLVVFLTSKYFKGAEGSGIPQVIAASSLVDESKSVTHLISVRIALAKICLGTLALFGGFSAGREGPSVQVSASIVNSIFKYLPYRSLIRQKDLILAGGAAGVAAAFNTPLAGIVFAIEELGKRIESRTSAVLLTVIIVSGLAAQSLLGNYNYFGSIQVNQLGISIAPFVLFCGLACGLLGGLFTWILLMPMNSRVGCIWRFKTSRPVAFAGVCGLIVAIIGIATGGVSFGSGYSITASALSGEFQLPWYASIGRYISTIVSYFSGIPGGLFAPALATGAAIGSNLTSLLGDISQSKAIMALCMAGFLSAVTQAPITSSIIVMEMIDGHQMVISLMAVTLISKFISSKICPGLYSTLATRWMDDKSKQDYR